MSRLLCNAEQRIGAPHIKHHPFFYGIDWNNLRRGPAPFVPQLQSITDTSYFPVDELNHVPEDVQMDVQMGTDTFANNAHKDLAFVGYTFKRWDTLRNDL